MQNIAAYPHPTSVCSEILDASSSVPASAELWPLIWKRLMRASSSLSISSVQTRPQQHAARAVFNSRPAVSEAR